MMIKMMIRKNLEMRKTQNKKKTKIHKMKIPDDVPYICVIN